ncbi:Hypothetical protein PMN2A_2183 [Prochlorococcus marinus str. NATL2A]|uniref:Uncharacterized protein n=1 Tax=Prochlorococcus marinus (strain NATL2A) TaxID=59920 RepID=A7ME14_PROMT|nr:Hypothetical protein PMN2A_2183 [Prochlorococcus marinus str. NATL2A]
MLVVGFLIKTIQSLISFVGKFFSLLEFPSANGSAFKPNSEIDIQSRSVHTERMQGHSHL